MFVVHLTIIFLILCVSGEKYDVVVIGSGISGLSSASYLSQHGKKVAIVEQCFNIGGSIQTFKRKGASGLEYSFEVGMHVLQDDAPTYFEEISGEKIEMNPLGSFTDILLLNTTDISHGLFLPHNLNDFFNYVYSSFPKDKEAIDTFIETLHTIKNDSLKMSSFLPSITKNKKLIYTLSYLESYTSMMFDFPVSLYHVALNFNFGKRGTVFPAGSSEKIVKGAISQIEKNDGKIFTNCEAKRLDLNLFGKVEKLVTSCGDFETSHVISTIGAKNTFNENFIKKSVLEKHGYLQKTKELIPTPTGMLHFVGFNISNEILKLPNATIWFDTLEELGTTNSNFDLFKIRNMFATTPTTRNPALPRDRTMFVMNNDAVLYSWFSKWEDSKTHKRPADYYEFKKKFEDSAIQWMYDTFPQTKGKVDLIVSSSPLTIRDFLNHPNGTIYASAEEYPDTFQWLTSKTKIDGLFLAGQEIQNFGGVQRSCKSGISTAQLILDEKN